MIKHESEIVYFSQYSTQERAIGMLFMLGPSSVTNTYVQIRQHTNGKRTHFCIYLNCDKADVDRCDSLEKFMITFEGPSSRDFSIPTPLIKLLAIPERNYWVGADYSHQSEPPTIHQMNQDLTELHRTIFKFFFNVIDARIK